MARYIREFRGITDPNRLFEAINQYLASENYKYVQYDGENVFKKGKGFFTAPSFIKLTFMNDGLRLEAWLKYAIIPGVYIDEMDLEGFFAAAPKSILKKKVEQVESIISFYTDGSVVSNTQQYDCVQFCTQCGARLTPDAQFCTQCGQSRGQNIVTQYEQPIQTENILNKNEFRDTYIKGFKKDIRNVSIVCYFCVGLNAIIALAYYPWGIIDILILLGLTLGMHLGKSKGCAIALLVVSCVETLIGLISTGSVTGILWIIMSILAINIFSKADKKYKEYQSGN